MTAPTVDQVLAALPEGTKVTTFGPGALYDSIVVTMPGKDQCPLTAGDPVCTYEVCHYQNDPAKQAACPIC